MATKKSKKKKKMNIVEDVVTGLLKNISYKVDYDDDQNDIHFSIGRKKEQSKDKK